MMQDLLRSFILPLFAYSLLPGCALMIGWITRQPAGKPSHHTSSIACFGAIDAVVGAWGAIMLALAGWFRVEIIGVLLALSIVYSLARRRVFSRSHAVLHLRPSLGASAALLLVLLSAWLLARPAETFMVTDDSGVYTLGAVHLARTGGLQYDEPGVLPLEPSRGDLPVEPHTTAYWDWLQDYARQYMLPENVGTPGGTRFWGPFFQPVLYRSQLEIGFLPLTKIVGALFGWVLGVERVIWAGPALALLALVVWLDLLRRDGDWGLALPSGLYLTLSLPQLWFGRQLMSEPLTQVLILGILWLDRQARDTSDASCYRILTLGEAAALGLLPLVRLEGTLLAAILLLAIAVSEQQRRCQDRTLWKMAAIALFLGQLLAVLASPAYLYSRLIGALSSGAPQWIAGGMLIAALCVLILDRTHLVVFVDRRWHSLLRHNWRRALGCLLGGTYFVVVLLRLLSGDLTNSYNGWLAQYLTRPGLLLGALGLALAPLITEPNQRSVRALALAGATFGLLISLDPAISWSHPWAMRRAVPLLLPALSLGIVLASRAIVGLFLALTKRSRAIQRLAWMGNTTILLALCLGVAQRSQPFLTHRERAGMWQQLQQLDTLLAPSSVVLLDDGQIGRQLAQALAFVHGHQVYNVQQSEALTADSEMIQRLLGAALEHDRTIYWLVSDPSRRFEPAGFTLESVGGVQFDTLTVRPTPAGPPSAADIAPQRFLVDVYRLVPLTEQSATLPDASIPLGVGSYPYLISGFYPLEEHPAFGPFRWTAACAVIQTPWPGAANDELATFELQLSLSGWRPSSLQDPVLSILAEDRPVLRIEIPAQGQLIALQVPVSRLVNTGKDALEMELCSTTFVPAALGLGADTRELGVQIFDVAIEPFLGGD